MAEYTPACTYDGIDVGYDVGIYDKGILSDSIIFSTADTIVADGDLAKAESFGITDGVHYLMGLLETLLIADSITKAGDKGIVESLSLSDIIATDGDLAKAEALSTIDSLAKNGDLGKAETFSLTDSLIKAGAEAIAESLSIADGITTDGGLTKIESFSITDGMHNIIILTETFSVADSEEFKKYMYMKIRKINVTFSAGNYESVIELED
jgi:hypothetical protein